MAPLKWAGPTEAIARDEAEARAWVARAGIPVPRVQIATIEAARVMGEDRDYGSVAAGKVADLAVVDGKPAERLGDLSKIETVLRGGRLYRVADLKAAFRPEGGGPNRYGSIGPEPMGTRCLGAPPC